MLWPNKKRNLFQMSKATPPPATPVEEIPKIVDDLRAYFNTGVTKPLSWRITQLKGLIKLLDENGQAWVDAMNEDMGSHHFEGAILVANIRSEIEHTIKNLDTWLRPKKLPNPWALYPGSTSVVPEPYGVVLDFIPYNYPMYLGFSTILPILACGNVCLFKPSSKTPACAKLYHELFPKYLDPKGVIVICGPTRICDDILRQRFDFIFYTGSPNVGKVVQKAASQYLTPTLLELGGKSPVYVDESLSLTKCVRRLVWGKYFNGGQTCVCPDYCLVNEKIWDKFKEELLKVLQEFYGDITQYNDNITHIICKQHYDRIVQAIETSGGQVIANGFRDPERLYIGPTVVESPQMDSTLMTEEIFGPVLPIVKISGAEEAIEFINKREKPLALYVLSDNSNIIDLFTRATSSGALMVNDTTFHVSSPYSPFGGVGNSGMGQYHGKYGIRSLSHSKPVVTHSTLIDLDIRYPPYTDSHLSILKKFA